MHSIAERSESSDSGLGAMRTIPAKPLTKYLRIILRQRRGNSDEMRRAHRERRRYVRPRRVPQIFLRLSARRYGTGSRRPGGLTATTMQVTAPGRLKEWESCELPPESYETSKRSVIGPPLRIEFFRRPNKFLQDPVRGSKTTYPQINGKERKQGHNPQEQSFCGPRQRAKPPKACPHRRVAWRSIHFRRDDREARKDWTAKYRDRHRIFR